MRIYAVGFILNPKNPLALKTLKNIGAHLQNKGISVLVEDIKTLVKTGIWKHVGSLNTLVSRSQMVVALGGDGTLLRAARYAAPLRKPLLGINLGRLGFLTSTAPELTFSILNQGLEGKLKRDIRVMIEGRITRKGRIVSQMTALNDIVITRGTLGRMVELGTSVDGEYLTTYRSDGLIIATPTGSTAYALSVGGPILNTTVPNLVLAPISPHTLSNRPVVLSNKSRVEVSILTAKGSLIVTADGQIRFSVRQGDKLVVRKASNAAILLVPRTYNYWDVLRSKLGWKGN